MWLSYQDMCKHVQAGHRVAAQADGRRADGPRLAEACGSAAEPEIRHCVRHSLAVLTQQASSHASSNHSSANSVASQNCSPVLQRPGEGLQRASTSPCALSPRASPVCVWACVVRVGVGYGTAISLTLIFTLTLHPNTI